MKQLNMKKNFSTYGFYAFAGSVLLTLTLLIVLSRGGVYIAVSNVNVSIGDSHKPDKLAKNGQQ